MALATENRKETERKRERERERERERARASSLVPRDGSWLLVADARRVVASPFVGD